MNELDSSKLASWLSLTPQEFGVLSCVFRLQDGRVDVSPHAIQEEYKSSTGRLIQKPNLFTVLKGLRARGFLERVGRGDYAVDVQGVKSVLAERACALEVEASEFKRASQKVDVFFRKSSKIQERPFVRFLAPSDWSRTVARSLRGASQYFSTTSFPNLSFDPKVASCVGRPEYVDVLWERCVIRGDVSVTYLTDLNVEYLHDFVSSAYQDTEVSQKVCLSVLDQLQSHIEETEKLKVYFWDEPLYFDLHMPVSDTPREYFTHLRGLRSEILGVVHVRSQDAAEASKALFLELAERGTLLEGSAGRKIINKTKKKVREYVLE